MEISNCLIALIWFVGVLYWDVSTDYKKWKKKKPVDHTTDWLLRGLLIIPSTVLLSLPEITLQRIGAALLMQGFLWWELFDGFYNLMRGFSWRFNGTVDPDDSFLDKILHKLSPLQETILKWGLIIIFTSLYILS